MGPVNAGPVIRVDGWQELLARMVEEARARPFEWSVHDCPTWAFEVRQALTGGEDVAALWRGKYRTAAGGQRMLRRLGWADTREMGMALLGAPLATPRLCQRGDIVLQGGGFGVVVGANAVGMEPQGLRAVPLTQCDLGWRV